ncbi:MAG TPA: site-2 protease family protein [Candidatus Binatia bacterium]|nr:site-2 protease family protein [Candidatus Binatia bacterium]
MRWSLKLGKIAGIRIYLHWTFLILPLWVFFSDPAKGMGLPNTTQAALFIVALFTCIVLHELGHALAARRYGISTRDITLLPIGGVARMERMPREPKQELWVAVAGPLVNVAIAGLLIVVLLVLQIPATRFLWPHTVFLPSLLVANWVLIVFNLLPAFPMDGGRVFRALLAQRLEYVRATRIAARVGQVMAILFVIVGLTIQHPMLMLIGVFIFFGARNEAHIVEVGRNLDPEPARQYTPNYFLRG